MARVARHETARRARCSFPASSATRRTSSNIHVWSPIGSFALRKWSAGKIHCRDRLRAGRSHPSANRVGKACSAGGGGQARDPRALALMIAREDEGMKRSIDRILTTHVGSLPRPNDLIELYRDDAPDDKLQPRLTIGGCRCGPPASRSRHRHRKRWRVRQSHAAVDRFGAWWSYVYDRLAGFELRQEQAKKGRAAWTFGSKERKEFAEFYAAEASAGQSGSGSGPNAAQSGTSTARMYGLTCTGPVNIPARP